MTENLDKNNFDQRIEFFIGEARAAFRTHHLLCALDQPIENATSTYWKKVQATRQNHGQMPLVVIDALEDHLTLFVTRLWGDGETKPNLKPLRNKIDKTYFKHDDKLVQVVQERWSAGFGPSVWEVQLNEKFEDMEANFKQFGKSKNFEAIAHRRNKFVAHSDDYTKLIPNKLLLQASIDIINLVQELGYIWNPEEAVRGFDPKFAEIEAQSFWGSLYPDAK